MRFRALLLPLYAAQHAAAAAIQPREIDGLSSDLESGASVLPHHTRRIMAERKRQVPPMSSPNDPKSVSYIEPPASKVQETQTAASVQYPGAKYKKIRYGPYRIPPTSEENAEFKVMNMRGIANLLTLNATKPCTTDCVLQGLTAGLEYADGSPAVITNGAWLHHVVLWNVGPDVNDAVCRSGKIDLGGQMGGLMDLEPGWGVEHLFESGNERTYVDFAVKESPMKIGYKLHTSDELLFNVELMNMDDREKWVWVTLNWDYLEGEHPEYKEGKILWMSIGPDRCGNNKPNPFGPTNLTSTQQPTKEKFVEYSIPWVAPADGYIMGGNGHLHEGGVSTSIFINEKSFCTSYPHYAKSNGSSTGGMGHGRKRQLMGSHGEENVQIEHIEKQGGCLYPEGIRFKKGDNLYINADYDFTKHPGMKNKKGEIDEVMAITGSIVAFDKPLKINRETQEVLRH